MNTIEISNLSKFYGKSRGVENIDLEVREGEIFGFIGPNGAGKSTTIRTMLNLIAPTKGEIRIFGMDSVKEAEKIAQHIGYLPSEVFYYDDMKVKDLLHYSASFYKKDCSRKITELSDILELDLNRKIEDLSYGNRKKVGIVQGLLHDPKLIILDEPTSGLDPLMQQKFFQLLLDENRNGKTIFFSSHILSEVQKLCHRVAIIKEGGIIKLQDMAALKKETYKRFTIDTGHNLSDILSQIPGISDLYISEHLYRFIYKGDLNPITGLLSGIDIRDILIEEPTLEEIFLHYYEKEEKK
ncbi:MAG: ABC transporter ATP-binding protein [Clostridia bacterium]|nr:ABC transporter ATP-binding protein [Clostridia bacterium]